MSALQHSIYKGFLASEAVKGVHWGCTGIVLKHRTFSCALAGNTPRSESISAALLDAVAIPPPPSPSPTAVAALEGRKLERDKALATLPAINALKKLCCHPDMVGWGCWGV